MVNITTTTTTTTTTTKLGQQDEYSTAVQLAID
jgi:hypothetical protein